MSEQSDRDDCGRFESGLTDEAIMRQFADGRPFHTAQEIADQFDIDRSTAYRRLSGLGEDGSLEKVTLGSRTVVWWNKGTEQIPDEIDPDDPLFSAPTITVDDPVSEDEIDGVLYDDSGI
jgi:hypothetical protein